MIVLRTEARAQQKKYRGSILKKPFAKGSARFFWRQ